MYDSTEYSNRLVLRLTGMMSEAELHILKQRMYQGKLNKARRGELIASVSTVFVESAAGEVTLDLDERARGASAAVGRLLKRLHVRHLVAEIPRTRRWRVTERGRHLLGMAAQL